MVAVTNIVPLPDRTERHPVAVVPATGWAKPLPRVGERRLGHDRLAPVAAARPLRRSGLFYVAAALIALAGIGFLITADPLAAPGTIGAESEAYVVAEGDTMWTIAQRLAPAGEAGQFLEHLVAINGTTIVETGQSLHIPTR